LKIKKSNIKYIFTKYLQNYFHFYISQKYHLKSFIKRTRYFIIFKIFFFKKIIKKMTNLLEGKIINIIEISLLHNPTQQHIIIYKVMANYLMIWLNKLEARKIKMEWEWDMKLGRRSPNLYNKKTKNAPHSMYVSPKSEARGLCFF
jgi:hypothetical protein